MLDIEFPSKETILEVMDSINEPKHEIMHQSYSPYLEPTIFSMMSRDLRLGEFSRASNSPPSLDTFLPWLFFLELAIEFFASPSIEDSCFVLPSCLDGSHQGAFLVHRTTHNEYLYM
jgi:hypothetical protein